MALGSRTPPPLVAAPELERLRLFDAVLRLVEWAATGRPVLLVAEDTHRADRASLALCAHIGRRLAGMPVLFVLTRRDRPTRADADALLADLAGRGLDVTESSSGRCSPGRWPRSPAVSRRSRHAALDEVVAVADGNPLLAVESARALTTGRSAPRAEPARDGAGRTGRGARSRPRPRRSDRGGAGRALTTAEIGALPATADAEREVLDTGLVGRVHGGLAYRHALLAEAARAEPA